MVRDRVQRGIQWVCALACAALVVGCAEIIHNDPVNRPLADNGLRIEAGNNSHVSVNDDDFEVGLAFSGGGTRAAAFSYGVLTGFGETQVSTTRHAISLLDHIDFVSGVSGGSIIAAYYGLKGREALSDFRERFLLANPELQTNFNFFNIAHGLDVGINDSVQFSHWLDAHLFNNATFKELLARRRPVVWINASDIYNRTAFPFTPVTFSALCSDLPSYPISLAVAASTAVPIVFAPVVVQNYLGDCPTPLPEWIDRVRHDQNAAPIMKSYAEALERYRTGKVKYVKLLDGGLVDNYGLAAITITRLANKTPYGPLEPEEAVKLRRFLFLVVDAGRAPSGAWVGSVAGPSGIDLINAASDTAIESGALSSYSLFQDTMNIWRQKLIDWRCQLSEADLRRYHAPPAWNCKDVKFFIGRIAFEDLGPERAGSLDRIKTTLRLPPDQVDMLIAAGHDALKNSPVFHAFLQSLPSVQRPSVVPIAIPMAGSKRAGGN
jgi:predicted acylesterase/phospholipase RssA